MNLTLDVRCLKCDWTGYPNELVSHEPKRPWWHFAWLFQKSGDKCPRCRSEVLKFEY